MSTGPILITGAAGQLGRLVIQQLHDRSPATPLIALVRNPAAVTDLAARGVEIRAGDYENTATLDAAVRGAERVLLISSNVLGRRVSQHKNVVAAAKRAGVGFLAYTSVLHADKSILGLAEDHRQTEAAVRESGLSFAVLRNGWYTENYTASIGAALAHSAVVGSAGDGRISSAARLDYAAAAAVVLLGRQETKERVYELAGDTSYSLSEFAAELSRQTGKDIPYRNLAQDVYKGVLLGAGLPEPIAGLLADSDAAAAKDALFDDGKQLSRLIGRPTTGLAVSITQALSKLT